MSNLPSDPTHVKLVAMRHRKKSSKRRVALWAIARLSFALGTFVVTFGLFLGIVTAVKANFGEGVVISIISLLIAITLWTTGIYLFRKARGAEEPKEGDWREKQ